MSRCIPKVCSEQVKFSSSQSHSARLKSYSCKHAQANVIYDLTFWWDARKRPLICSAILIKMDSPVSLLSDAMIPLMKKKTSFSSLEYLSSVKTLTKSFCLLII